MNHPMMHDGRPWTRWWWFSGPIERDEITAQLDWVASKGFGGVEIAWVYPLEGARPDDGPRYLDREFQALVDHAIKECMRLGLGCDLSFGTLWPFSGTFIAPEHRSKTFHGPSMERINRSWEARYEDEDASILDHLDKEAFAAYATYHLERGFRTFARQAPLAFFSDSWEIDPKDLSFDGFFETFAHTYGYDYPTKNPSVEERYDYRSLLSTRTLEHFFSPFADMCRANGALSRVQCHGAPTDLLQAYALVDIPETETLLFDPKFSLIAASSAAFTDKRVVSSESFTCLYGWVPSPDIPPGIREECIEDLRCIADAQFAWGVNRVVYHGMPYAPHRFYATVHIGEDGALTPYLSPFNDYLRRVSELLSEGESVSTLAILLPLEDQWMADELPDELKKPSSHYYWELQELDIPEALSPYRPLLFSPSWLDQIIWDGLHLTFNGKDLGALYVLNEWMDHSSLSLLARLADEGAPIIFARLPKEPGTRRHPDYQTLLERLAVHHGPLPTRPLLECDETLDFWCKRREERYILFISHPRMRNLRYPLPYRYHTTVEAVTLQATLSLPTNSYRLTLDFPHCASLCFEIDDRTRTIREIPLPASFTPR